MISYFSEKNPRNNAVPKWQIILSNLHFLKESPQYSVYKSWKWDMRRIREWSNLAINDKKFKIGKFHDYDRILSPLEFWLRHQSSYPNINSTSNHFWRFSLSYRYEAERLLENKTEGTFLLRDSAQEEYLFSVSFRKYGRSLHARIEQWNHRFSFDSHDPGVFSSKTVCGLIEHYKDPTCCMFFEPMLTIPLHRNTTFSLQHLCRAVICDHLTYDSISYLKLPKTLKTYLKEYHYKQRVRVRKFETEP